MVSQASSKRRRQHKTFSGRIVYDRPTHYLSMADVLRMIKKVDLIRDDRKKFIYYITEIMKQIALKIYEWYWLSFATRETIQQLSEGFGQILAAIYFLVQREVQDAYNLVVEILFNLFPPKKP